MLTEKFLVLSRHSGNGEEIGKAGQVQPETTPQECISCSPGGSGKSHRVFICPKGGGELREVEAKSCCGATDVSEEVSTVNANDQRPKYK